jgi:hypothetical protein
MGAPGIGLSSEANGEWTRTLESAVSDQSLAHRFAFALWNLLFYGPSPNEATLRLRRRSDVRVRVRAAKLMGVRTRESAESDLLALLQDSESMGATRGLRVPGSRGFAADAGANC